MASLWTMVALGVLLFACVGTSAMLPTERRGDCAHQRALVMLQARRLARLAASNRHLVATTELLCARYDPGNKSGKCGMLSDDARRRLAVGGARRLASTISRDWRRVHEMPRETVMRDPAVGNGTSLEMLQVGEAVERKGRKKGRRWHILKGLPLKPFSMQTMRGLPSLEGSQRELVEAMRKSFLDREGGLREYAETYWVHKNPCGWTGLMCHLSKGILTRLILDFRNVTLPVAPLPTTVVNITSVKTFEILGGTFAGFDQGWKWTSASMLKDLKIDYPGPTNLPNMSRLRHLERVNLSGIRPIPQVNIFSILPKSVRSLFLSDIWLPEGSGSANIVELALRNTNVRSFDLTGVQRVLFSQNRHLEHLHIPDTDGGTLETLSVKGSPLLTDLPDLHRLRHLKNVCIEGCGLRHIDLGRFPLSYSRSLLLSNNRIRSINGTVPVALSPYPRKLDFSNNLLRNIDLDLISRLTPRWLLLANNSIASDPYPVTTQAARERLQGLHIADCTGNPFCVMTRSGIYNKQSTSAFVELGLFCPAWLELVRELKKTGFLGSFAGRSRSLRTFRNPCIKATKELLQAEHLIEFTCERDRNIINRFALINHAKKPLPLPNLDAVVRIPTLRQVIVQNFKDLTRVPLSLKNTRGDFDYLAMTGCSITRVPAWLLQSEYMGTIDLSNNPISEIDDLPNNAATGKSKVKKLILERTHIVEIPKSVGSLPFLNTLRLDNNPGLRSLELASPDLSYVSKNLRANIKALGINVVSAKSCGLRAVKIERNVVRVDLRRNLLTSLPDIWFGRLVFLDLAHNRLTHFDSVLAASSRLTSLDLSNNRLTKVRVHPSHLNSLIHLHLSNNQIEHFHGELRKSLFTLDLSKNKLREYRGPVYRRNDLSHNHLRSVTFSGRSTYYAEILLAHNELGSGPGLQTSPGTLYNTIDLSHNGLKGRDASRYLQEPALSLDMSFNNIDGIDARAVADFFTRSDYSGFFKGLRVLNLVGNLFVNGFGTGLDDRLPKLQGQNSLDLDEVAVMPAEIRRLSYSVTQSHQEWIEGDAVATGAGRRCAYLSSPMIPGLRLYRCECSSDYYARLVRGRAVGCELCVPFALCQEGRIHCSEGYYLDMSGPKPRCVTCRPMEDGAECYDNMVVPRQGFWKPHENATSVYECRNKAVCGGGIHSTRNCLEGHTGSLCSVCERGYYKTSAALCQECPGTFTSIIYMATMVLGCVVLVAGLALPGALKHGIGMATRDSDVTVEATMETATEASGLVKMLIAFMQVLVMFPSVYAVDFGQWLDVIADWFQWMDFDFMSASSVECLQEGLFGSDSQYTFYHSMCLQASIPIIAVLLAVLARLVVDGVRMVIRPAAGVTGQQVRGIVIRAAFLAILFVYLPVSTSGSQFFKCSSFDGGATMYLDSDLTLQCYTSTWYSYMPVAVFILVAYSLGLPLLIMTLLAPAGLDVTLAKARHGWTARAYSYVVALMRSMFPIYKKRFAWWEATELLRRFLVTSLAVHYSTSGQLQITVAMVVSFFALLLHMQCQPFARADLNTVQTILLVMVFANLSVGILKSLEVEEGVHNWVTAFVIGMDALVMAMMVVMAMIKVSAGYTRIRRAGGRRMAVTGGV